MESPIGTNAVSSARTDYGSTSQKDNRTELAESEVYVDRGSYQRIFSDLSWNRPPAYRAHPSTRFTRMTADSMPNSKSRQILDRIEFSLNVLNQICIGFVTIYMSWMCLRIGLANTALHAWLVTIGFQFLMAEAIMCHYHCNVLTFSYKRPTKTRLHWVFQALGGGLGVTGALIKCIQKGFLIYTTHGKLGFAALILCLISMLSGVSALFSMRVKNMLSPLLNKTVHNILGMATFAVALSAQFYGYQTGFFSRKVDDDFQALMKVLTLMSLVLTSIGPLTALFSKLRNIRRHFS